jgi:hypothetical protein
MYPPTKTCRHYSVFAHRDGRRVLYVRGMASATVEESKSPRGHGTLAIHFYDEAFPGEVVCSGCTGEVESGTIDESGELKFSRMASSPSFNGGVRSDYCPKCRMRVAKAVLEEFERKMRTLGVDNYGCLQK